MADVLSTVCFRLLCRFALRWGDVEAAAGTTSPVAALTPWPSETRRPVLGLGGEVDVEACGWNVAFCRACATAVARSSRRRTA